MIFYKIITVDEIYIKFVHVLTLIVQIKKKIIYVVFFGKIKIRGLMLRQVIIIINFLRDKLH